MFEVLLSLLWSFRVYFRSQADLQAEILALRHQIVVLQSIGKMNAVFLPWAIREFRDRSEGKPRSIFLCLTAFPGSGLGFCCCRTSRFGQPRRQVLSAGHKRRNRRISAQRPPELDLGAEEIKRQGALFLNVSLQCHSAGERSVDVSLGIGRYAFLRSIRVGIGNGSPDLAVLCAADCDALVESRVRLR